MLRVRTLSLVCIATGLLSLPALAQPKTYKSATSPKETGNPTYDRLVKEVRHELVTLPFLSIFEDLSFRVDGRTVTLLGWASRPILKSDAENVVKRIEGVEKVVNQIEVLPLSIMDDRIRVATARTIFGSSTLSRYGMQAIPSIHIIVKNGNVTLEGIVAAEMDKNIAGTEANSVPGVFKVTNNLIVGPRK